MMKEVVKLAISVVASLSATAASAINVCDKPYWPYSQFREAPAAFSSFVDYWPTPQGVQDLVRAHHHRVELEFRTPIGPCRPSGLPRFLDAMFGGIFTANEEERLRAVNGFYEAFAESCHIVNWERIQGSASNRLSGSPHVIRYGDTSDPMCGHNAVFLTAGSGLIAMQMEGGSCDMHDFRATKVRAISLNSILDGIHSSDSIMERLFDYIGEGDQLELAPYGQGSPDHLKLGIKPLNTGWPMFPTLFTEQPQVLPFGRSYQGRFFLIYPTLNNPRGESNRFFPTFTSSLRVDIVEVTDAERERRVLRDACRHNSNNTDQPILSFR